MIDGLKIDLTADELTRLLEERIEHHKDVAADCDARRIRLQAVARAADAHAKADLCDAEGDDDDTDEHLAAAWPPYLEHLERRAERHRDRAGALQFLRDHLVAHEVYRLGEDDLALLQLWPQDTQVSAVVQEAS